MECTIVIWGPDNYNMLGLLRQLSSAKEEVFLLINGADNKCATKSIYCKSYRCTKDYKEGLEYLIQNYKVTSNKHILIPTGDRAAEVIDDNKPILESIFVLMGTSQQGLLKRIDNKIVMVSLAQKCGFIVPKSYKFSVSSPVANFPYPCILKPANSEGLKEFKTRIIRNQKELEKLKSLLNPHHIYILQELIPKKNDILVYGLRRYNGEIILAGQYIKDRWSDDGGGSHGLLTKELPKYLQLDAINLLLNTIDYKGLFSIEYGLVDGIAYFYEINLRNDGTSHLFYQAGANLPLYWVNDCRNRKNKHSAKVIENKWNINEIYDFINVLKRRISLKKYLTDKKQATVYHYYSDEDKEPWRIAKLKALWDLPLRAFLLKFRPHIVYLKSKLDSLKHLL